jgi:predicted sugar kinase
MGDDARRTIGVGGTMRLLLATTLTLASLIASSAQTPTRISEVAKLVEMRTFRGETYPIFNYQGVFVQGDVSLKDYNDTTAVVRQELRVGEEIIEVIASQQVSLYRQYGKDLIVRTCVGPCGKGKGTKLPDGRTILVDGGNSGREFVFEQAGATLQVSAKVEWID